MITTTEVLAILFIHWVADFIFQTDKMATGKSKNWTDLLSHTTAYSVIWAIPFYILLGTHNKPLTCEVYLGLTMCFCIITFIAHTVTDYLTYRLNSRLWNEKKVHYFFVSIGFDQWLHYAQLFVTYNLLRP